VNAAARGIRWQGASAIAGMLRMRSPFLAIALLAAACASTHSHTVVSSSLALVDGGRAVAEIRTGGIERVQMRLDNQGPAKLAFEARDEFEHVLDQGELGRGVRLFEWRPLEHSISLTLTAHGTGGARVEYSLSSEGGVDVAWNLTNAQNPPAK
jgi:hypothetical protein